MTVESFALPTADVSVAKALEASRIVAPSTDDPLDLRAATTGAHASTAPPEVNVSKTGDADDSPNLAIASDIGAGAPSTSAVLGNADAVDDAMKMIRSDFVSGAHQPAKGADSTPTDSANSLPGTTLGFGNRGIRFHSLFPKSS